MTLIAQELNIITIVIIHYVIHFSYTYINIYT